MNSIKNKASVKIVVYSLLSAAKLSFVGTLILSEVYAMFNALSFKRIGRLYRENPDVKRVHMALFIFLLVQMLSDVINHTSVNNMLRGWAAIGVALAMFTFLFRVFDDAPRIIVAFMVAEIVRMVFFGPVDLDQDTSFMMEDQSFFKFRIAPITNYIVLLITFYTYNKRKDNLTIAIFILYAFACIGLDYRSNGLFYLFAGLIIRFRNQLINMSLAQKLGLTVFIAIIFQLLYMYYVNKVLSGEYGGRHASSQLEAVENPYNPFSLIVNGRREFFVAIQAITDAPLLGHGSWAEDHGNHYRMMMLKDEDRDRAQMEAENNSGVIPSHSVLLGSWLYAGIVGFLCMAYLFYLAMKRAFSLIVNRRAVETPYYPIIVLFTLQLLWTFPFSPLQQIRNVLPLLITFIITIYNSLKQDEEYEEEDLLPDNG